MHAMLRAHARDYILKYLILLPEQCHITFRLMYGRKNGHRTVVETLSIPLVTVVMEVPDNKLEWAMTQVDKSVENMEKGEL